MSRILDDNHTTITGKMINQYHLYGNELILYALINGFSQDGESEFHGSLSYMQEWLGCSKNTLTKMLDNLQEKGLIEKVNNGTSKNNVSSYIATGSKIELVQKLNNTGSKIEQEKKEKESNIKNKEIKETFNNYNDIDNKGKTPIFNILYSYNFPKEINDTIILWLENRKQMKKSVTPNSMTQNMNNVKKSINEYGVKSTIIGIEKAIASGWQGLFFNANYCKDNNDSIMNVEKDDVFDSLFV